MDNERMIVKDNESAAPLGCMIEVSFLLGALTMTELLFRKEIGDPEGYRRYVRDLCEEYVPSIPYGTAIRYLLPRLQSPAREWVAEFYTRRASLS